MGRFIVRVEARNLQVELQGELRRLGFVTYRAVDAPCPEEEGESGWGGGGW